MKRSIAAMVAVVCVSMSSFVFADELGAEKFAEDIKQDMSGLSYDLNAQKTDLTNDLKAKKESAKSEAKAKRGEAKAKKSKPRLT